MSSLPPPSSGPPSDPAASPPPPGEAGAEVICEVTGRTLPEDETVVFQGRRVSAEGKQVLADRLNAGEAMPGELEDATRMARFGGGLLDLLIFGVIGCGVGAVSGGVAAASGTGTATLTRAMALGGILVGAVQLAYFALLHANAGQTLGKMAAKTRLVTADGGKISSGTAWVRALVYTGPNLLAQVPGLIFGGALGIGLVVTSGVQLVVGLFVLVNLLLIFRSSTRCLHDDIAGTRVVTTRA